MSEADHTFLAEWVEENRPPTVAELLAEQKVGSILVDAKLHRLKLKADREKDEVAVFEEMELEAVPEYYILYFSASW